MINAFSTLYGIVWTFMVIVYGVSTDIYGNGGMIVAGPLIQKVTVLSFREKVTTIEPQYM